MSARSSRRAALYREFRCGPVRITRYEYEALPLPMAALRLSDKTMAQIAIRIRDRMAAIGWLPDEVELACRKPMPSEAAKSEKVREDFSRIMEAEALDLGMKYR